MIRPSRRALRLIVLVGCVAAASAVAARAADDPVGDDVQSLVPTITNPVKIPAEDKDAHAAWAKRIDAYMSLPAEQVMAHPAAADFPGAVPARTPTVSRELSIPMNQPRWHSTGLYAAPGAKVTIRVSPEDVDRKLVIVIGCHTDGLTNLPKWVRFPRISRRFKITEPVTTVANAFGGLIYVDEPRDPQLGGYAFATYGGYGWQHEHPEAVAGTAHVRIEGAVAAPLYVLGQTTAAQWKQMLQLAAPWGELQSDKIILTVQTKHLSAVADPAALLKWWGKVVDTEAELAGWPKQPPPAERIVVDRDISAGWMHSGYPVMAHLATEKDLIDLPTLQAKGNWGYFHELGHNHEGQAYTFGGDYVEVDVNLFSMYVMQKLVGREMTAHPALKDMDKVLAGRLGPGKNTDAWGNLSMYVETIQAFGWPALQKTLASYATPTGSDGIKTREQKMDQWVLRYSRATGHNLAAYYKLFDVTCSDATATALKSLPTWMPPAVAKYAGS
jgi:hypothetical protein